MLFEVVRTSMYNDDIPFKKCVPIELNSIDERMFSSPEEFMELTGKDWHAKGTNHRISPNGYIRRDMGKVQRWGIHIDTLSDLLEFINQVENEVVIYTSFIDKETPCIEIYDDWRE